MTAALTYLPLFAGLFWKSGLVLGAALCLSRVLRNRSADLRRLVLSTAVVALLLSAAAAPALPRWTAVIPRWLPFQQPSDTSSPFQPAGKAPLDAPQLTSRNFPSSVPQPATRRADFTPWLLPLIWFPGAAFLLLRFAISLHRLHRLGAASEPVTDSRVLVEAARRRSPARLLQNETIAAPVTWGIFRPVILVPTGFEALSPESSEAVLCHELAHIEAADFLLRTLAEIARAALWFQPLMWIVRRQLHEEQELACDNRVLTSGGKASAYAKLLLDWDARPGMDFLVAVGIANRSCLKRRLYALLDPGLRRETVPPSGVAGAWLLALAVALPLAALTVTQDAPARRAPVQIAQATPAPQGAVQRPAPGEIAIAGDWAGSLALPEKALPENTARFVLHITGSANALKATAECPQLGLTGLSIDSISLSGPTLSFVILYDMKFSGDLNSNGTIVGTFTRHGTGLPLVLTRTIDPPVPPRVLTRPPPPFIGSFFHHDRTDVDFTLPPGWSVQQMETATNDPGEMAVLTDGGGRATWASVWMWRTETPSADIPKWLDASLTRKIAVRGGKTDAIIEAAINGYRIRPGSVEHTVVNGQQALRAIGEFGEGRELFTELLVWVGTEHARIYFDLRAQASQFETVRPAFDELIQSTIIP